MSWPNKTEYLWWPHRVGSPPTIIVSDISEDARRKREGKIKGGARVVPFGFARALQPEPEPKLWEGDGA